MADIKLDESEFWIKLIKLLRMEMYNEGELVKTINELILSYAKTRGDVIDFIFWDTLALIGKTWADQIKPVETFEGSNIEERSQKFEYTIDRLDKYSSGIPYKELPPGLFKAELCKIKYEGEVIEVEQLQRVDWEWTLVKSLNNGDLYLDYLIPSGFTEFPAIYKLSSQEEHFFEAGELDLQELYLSLWRK